MNGAVFEAVDALKSSVGKSQFVLCIQDESGQRYWISSGAKIKDELLHLGGVVLSDVDIILDENRATEEEVATRYQPCSSSSSFRRPERAIAEADSTPAPEASTASTNAPEPADDVAPAVPRESTRFIYLENIDVNLKEEALEFLLAEFGPLEKLVFILGEADRPSSARAAFGDAVSAAKAKERMNGLRLGQSTISVIFINAEIWRNAEGASEATPASAEISVNAEASSTVSAIAPDNVSASVKLPADDDDACQNLPSSPAEEEAKFDDEDDDEENRRICDDEIASSHKAEEANEESDSESSSGDSSSSSSSSDSSSSSSQPSNAKFGRRPCKPASPAAKSDEIPKAYVNDFRRRSVRVGRVTPKKRRRETVSPHSARRVLSAIKFGPSSVKSSLRGAGRKERTGELASEDVPSRKLRPPRPFSASDAPRRQNRIWRNRRTIDDSFCHQCAVEKSPVGGLTVSLTARTASRCAPDVSLSDLKSRSRGHPKRNTFAKEAEPFLQRRTHSVFSNARRGCGKHPRRSASFKQKHSKDDEEASRRVCTMNIDPEAREKDFRSLMASFGEVEEMQIVRTSIYTPRSRATVQYFRQTDAIRAKTHLSGRVFGKFRLYTCMGHVQPYLFHSNTVPMVPIVYVKGIAANIQPGVVREVFRAFGVVEDIRQCPEPRNGRVHPYRGFFVLYQNLEGAVEACLKMDGGDIFGEPIDVHLYYSTRGRESSTAVAMIKEFRNFRRASRMTASSFSAFVQSREKQQPSPREKKRLTPKRVTGTGNRHAPATHQRQHPYSLNSSASWHCDERGTRGRSHCWSKDKKAFDMGMEILDGVPKDVTLLVELKDRVVACCDAVFLHASQASPASLHVLHGPLSVINAVLGALQTTQSGVKMIPISETIPLEDAKVAELSFKLSTKLLPETAVFAAFRKDDVGCGESFLPWRPLRYVAEDMNSVKGAGLLEVDATSADGSKKRFLVYAVPANRFAPLLKRSFRSLDRRMIVENSSHFLLIAISKEYVHLTLHDSVS